MVAGVSKYRMSVHLSPIIYKYLVANSVGMAVASLILPAIVTGPDSVHTGVIFF